MRNMLKNILSAAALAVLVATPSLAQDEEAAPAPRPASAYATIDYNLRTIAITSCFSTFPTASALPSG